VRKDASAAASIQDHDKRPALPGETNETSFMNVTAGSHWQQSVTHRRTKNAGRSDSRQCAAWITPYRQPNSFQYRASMEAIRQVLVAWSRVRCHWPR